MVRRLAESVVTSSALQRERQLIKLELKGLGELRLEGGNYERECEESVVDQLVTRPSNTLEKIVVGPRRAIPNGSRYPATFSANYWT